MRLSLTPIEPVRKTRIVPLDTAEAFELFTARMDTWWPMSTHSITEHEAAGVRFEPYVGGHIVERAPDGTEYRWADVIAWDPPDRFVVAWHPSLEPKAATILEVRFHPVAEGGTRVDLEHRAWEELGPERGPSMRNGYERGWDIVLGPFEQATMDGA